MFGDVLHEADHRHPQRSIGAMLEAMTELANALRSAHAAETAETHDTLCFVPLLTLESGARMGPCARIAAEDGAVGWAAHDGDRLIPFSEANARHFVELLESDRRHIDDQIERAASERGLPVDEALFSLPAAPLVRAITVTRSPHYCRLALAWLLPTELRELRDDIAPLVDDTSLPHMVRELAQRLLVPR
jgi:hypothetical protein